VLLTLPLFNPNFGYVPVAPDRPCWGQIYENAKRKDSSRMEAQIILYENAKDKKLECVAKPSLMVARPSKLSKRRSYFSPLVDQSTRATPLFD